MGKFMKPLLTMQGITKVFGNTRALDDVGITLRPGEVQALMGENGAGKSTLMKILIGLYHADAGTVRLDDRTVAFASPREALTHGIAMIHQELYPVRDMTVADNIFLGREIRTLSLGPLSLVDAKTTRDQAAGLLRDMGLAIDPATPMRNLSVAETQLVEIIKAVSHGARIIIMDEPTSAITEREADQLFSHIERLKADGMSIVYISHKMDEIFRISDVITVLRDSRLVDSQPARDLTPEALVRMMVGREIGDVYPPADGARQGDRPALEVIGLSDGAKFADVSFSLYRGEVLGMAGLMGAGRSEVAECVFGITKQHAGAIRVDGKSVAIASPKDAIAAGMALVSDDRKLKGLNLEATVGENIGLLRLPAFATLGVINARREQVEVEAAMKRFGVKAESAAAPVASLSGGNQQKVVLAKWLLTTPDIIIFDEPTRGIDVGAKHDIYLLIRELARIGKAILMISSEMPEIVGMADRIVVMADGRLTGELRRDEITQEAIMTLASNLHAV